jgi:ribosome biogenesis GTPase
MQNPVSFLSQLGWRACYSQQLHLTDLERYYPARIASVHRNLLRVLSDHGELAVNMANQLRDDEPDHQATVGDWVLVEREAPRITRVLQRASLVARVAAGSQRRVQTIAANIDSLFVVTSCNGDFNLSRLERYLAMALDAHIEPVIVLTKMDLTDDARQLVSEAQAIAGQTAVVAINALHLDSAQALAPWLTTGQTVACVGSSGVGKSTLINTLSGQARLSTAAIREDDAKGRHTTTSRQLLAITGGAWLIDTPGMRELNIGAADLGMRAVFTDIEALARACRFRDCSHRDDIGCALRDAVANGSLEQRRLDNYLKLQREIATAALTVHERHERDRKFGRMHKAVMQQHRRQREP